MDSKTARKVHGSITNKNSVFVTIVVAETSFSSIRRDVMPFELSMDQVSSHHLQVVLAKWLKNKLSCDRNFAYFSSYLLGLDGTYCLCFLST